MLEKRDFIFEPISLTKGIFTDDIKGMLRINYNKWDNLFCKHKWVYYKFGEATRQHRICIRCYKKEQEARLFSNRKFWIKEYEK